MENRIDVENYLRRQPFEWISMINNGKYMKINCVFCSRELVQNLSPSDEKIEAPSMVGGLSCFSLFLLSP